MSERDVITRLVGKNRTKEAAMTRSECRRRSEPGQSCLPGSHSYVANCSSDNGLHCLPALNGATGSLGDFPECLTLAHLHARPRR